MQIFDFDEMTEVESSEGKKTPVVFESPSLDELPRPFFHGCHAIITPAKTASRIKYELNFFI